MRLSRGLFTPSSLCHSRDLTTAFNFLEKILKTIKVGQKLCRLESKHFLHSARGSPRSGMHRTSMPKTAV